MNEIFHQKNPFIVPTNDGKYISEHFGLAATEEDRQSLAHMKAPPGWSEPFQTPDFDEYTLVIRGRKRVETPKGTYDLNAGESLYIPRGTRVRYSNPFEEETEYVSLCVPAFSPERVQREED